MMKKINIDINYLNKIHFNLKLLNNNKINNLFKYKIKIR